jgi:CubicO group peptidase (beta-lactamase class C family)
VKRERRSIAPAVLAFVLLCAASGPAAKQTQGRKPFEWQVARPERQGMSSTSLEALKNDLEARKSTGLLVIRNDAIVYEWYAAGQGPTKTHYTASMAKALVGGLSLGVALTDHRIALDDPAAKYVPQWKNDPRKGRITIRQLGSHTSGLDDAEADGLAHEKLTGWKGDFWKRLDPPNDPFTIARDLTPAIFEPGQTFQYSNPGIGMLTYAVTASLAGSRWPDVRALLRDRIMQPIGVPDEEWSIGYGKTYTVDGLPLVASWGGGGYTARAAARVGRLMLRQGDWDGTQLLSEDAVRQISSDAGTPGIAAMGWWSNNDNRYPALPRDTFWGSGAGHQVVVVIPSRNLIAVRNGESLGEAQEHHDTLNAILFTPLLKTIVASDAPPKGRGAYPPSPAISRIEWAPAEAIVRQAKGSDNFPLTWADDDQLYTAYGDGQGFEPFVPEKLSLGFAKILGSPPRFSGVNIRSVTGEQRGDGERGRKASGMLMVKGVLYLWTRNAGNSQLAWSTDHGRTWTWSDWKLTTSFGCPTFLNFGKNYAGARDNYVYIYSHDADSAYAVADRMVLARVPSDRIRNREAYEFLEQLGPARQPVWTRDIEQRGGVFVNPRGCYRSGITFNPALRRYLWCQIGPDKDSRFAGGLGVYDAPEPWGPWTTVYFTDKWDVGPGENASFPTKWMSADGKTLHLVFSGDDSFSVRRATVELTTNATGSRKVSRK